MQFKCPDGREASLADVNGVGTPEVNSACVKRTQWLLSVAESHRDCSADEDCFASFFVQAPGCFAFSRADPASFGSFRSLVNDSHDVCPVASLIPVDCGRTACSKGKCVVKVVLRRDLPSCQM